MRVLSEESVRRNHTNTMVWMQTVFILSKVDNHDLLSIIRHSVKGIMYGAEDLLIPQYRIPSIKEKNTVYIYGSGLVICIALHCILTLTLSNTPCGTTNTSYIRISLFISCINLLSIYFLNHMVVSLCSWLQKWPT